MAVKSLLCGLGWKGFSADYGLDAWAQCSSVRKLPQVISPSGILMGGIFCWKTQLLSINLHCPNRPPELRGMLLQEEWEGRLFCGEEMISVVDGLSEAGSGSRGVSTALESARCSACQLPSNAETESSAPMASGGPPACSSQTITVTPWARWPLEPHLAVSRIHRWSRKNWAESLHNSVEILFIHAVSDTG